MDSLKAQSRLISFLSITNSEALMRVITTKQFGYGTLYNNGLRDLCAIVYDYKGPHNGSSRQVWDILTLKGFTDIPYTWDSLVKDWGLEKTVAWLKERCNNIIEHRFYNDMWVFSYSRGSWRSLPTMELDREAPKAAHALIRHVLTESDEAIQRLAGASGAKLAHIASFYTIVEFWGNEEAIQEFIAYLNKSYSGFSNKTRLIESIMEGAK